MTAPQFDAEREVDLARWRRAVVALWWLPVAGLVIGAIVGVLYSFRGGTNYKATALISLGQPTSPGGALVPSYGTNPRAVSQIVSGAKFQEEAANYADMRPAALRGDSARTGSPRERRRPRAGELGRRSRRRRSEAAPRTRGRTGLCRLGPSRVWKGISRKGAKAANKSRERGELDRRRRPIVCPTQRVYWQG